MLRAPVLRFTDDIPNAQFWFAFDAANPDWRGDIKGQKLVHGKTFRVPVEWGIGAAYARCRGELMMSDPVIQPATPRSILEWLKCHPKEAAFRASQQEEE